MNKPSPKSASDTESTSFRLLAGFWEKAGAWALPVDAQGEGYLPLVRRHRFELGFCLLFIFSSSFGQTFLLSVFQPEWLRVFNLTPGQMGSLYGVVTLISGLLLPWAGRWLDRSSARSTATITLIGLGLSALLVAGAQHVAMLGVALFGLRFFGQGVCSNLGITNAARWFEQNRGKALSLVGTGYPLGELLLPGAVTLLIVGVGWRGTWGLMGTLCLAGLLPLSWWLLRRSSRAELPQKASVASNPKTAQRAPIARDWRFYAMLGMMAPLPFAGTGVIFFQGLLAESRGWGAAVFPTGFMLFAVVRALFSLSAGAWVDRLGAVRLIAVPSFAFAAGLACLLNPAPVWAYVFFVCLGVSFGTSGAITTAAMTELFGAEKIGAIRGLSSAVAVFLTAAAPWIFGLSLDAGYSMEAIIFSSALLVPGIAWPLSLLIRRDAIKS